MGDYELSVWREVARLEGSNEHQRVEVDGWLHCQCGEPFAPVGKTADAMYRNHVEDRAIDVLGMELALEAGPGKGRPFLARAFGG